MSTPTINKAVVTVLLAREHLPFIREWCQHHIDQGFGVFLFDNTGSTGSTRKTSVFAFGDHQKAGVDKIGNKYTDCVQTRFLSDEEISEKLRKYTADIPQVTVFEWKPKDFRGNIVHGQVEAYAQFIRQYKNHYDWAAFIDADEYLEVGTGCKWDDIISFAEDEGLSQIKLSGVSYKSRWDGHKFSVDIRTLPCYGAQHQGNKLLVKLSSVVRADIHWNWEVTGDRNQVIADPHQFFFKHYNKKNSTYNISPPLRYIGPNESIKV